MKLSELYVESDKLDAAAAKCDIASGEAGAVKISDGMKCFSTAMPGSTSAKEAAGAGKFVDDRAKQLADGLDEYGSAIRSAKQGYNTTDHSVSLDFKAVDKTLSEIA